MKETHPTLQRNKGRVFYLIARKGNVIAIKINKVTQQSKKNSTEK